MSKTISMMPLLMFWLVSWIGLAACKTSTPKSALPTDWKVDNEIFAGELQSHWAASALYRENEHRGFCYILLVVAPWCTVCTSRIANFQSASKDIADAVALGLTPGPPVLRVEFRTLDGDRSRFMEHYNLSHIPTVLADCGDHVVTGHETVMDFSRESIGAWALRLMFPLQHFTSLAAILATTRDSLFHTALYLCNATEAQNGNSRKDLSTTVGDPALDPTDVDLSASSILRQLSVVAKFRPFSSSSAVQFSVREDGSVSIQQKVDSWTAVNFAAHARRHAPHWRVFGVITDLAICHQLDLITGDVGMLRLKSPPDTISDRLSFRRADASCFRLSSGSYISPNIESTQPLTKLGRETHEFQRYLTPWVPRPVSFSALTYVHVFIEFNLSLVQQLTLVCGCLQRRSSVPSIVETHLRS